MEYNEYWSKEDNKLMRKMIKDGKSPNDIILFFGEDKLNHHPEGKYNKGGGKFDFNNIKRYDEFLNEIKMSVRDVVFNIKSDKSLDFNYLLNYHVFFKSNSDTEYVVDIICFNDNVSPFPNYPLYNISFTTKEQYDTPEYETVTNKNESIEILGSIINIFRVMDINIKNNIKNPIYVIGETNDIKKINFYRNIINDTLPEYIEIKGKSSINNGKDVYYYLKKD